MTGDSALELLLPELQQQILLQLESFDTLHALILASPRLYQVFRINKQITISTIARRRFHRAAIQDALAIERLTQLERPPFSQKTVLSFFKSTPDQQCQSSDSILPLSVSIGLCKFDATIQFFINDYAENTLPILSQLRSSNDSSIQTLYRTNDRDPPQIRLSKLESYSLRRAFCRFDTYRQLFARCTSSLDHDLRRCYRNPPLSVFQQGQMFFQHTPAYQVAEIACVRDYLCRRLRGIFDQVEDETVQALQAECPNPRDKQQAMDWDVDTGGRYEYFQEDETHPLNYGGKYYQRHHIEHLLSLGLPYIQRVLQAAGDERKDLLLRDNLQLKCDAQHERHFLTAALGLDPMTSHSEQYGWLRMDLKSWPDQETHLEAPPGWLWAHSDGFYAGLVDSASKGLRDWGYVFWDLDRLQKTGVLDRKYFSQLKPPLSFIF